MREGTWFVDRWYKTCMKCDLSVGDEDASYCPNCGKWLGSIRQHVTAFFMAAAGAFVVAIGMAIVAYINEGALINSILATVFGGLGLGALSAIKPFGEYLVRLEGKKRRAEAWNEEVARHKKWAEEDRAERERSARAKADSGITVDLRIDAEECRKALEECKEKITEMIRAPIPPLPREEYDKNKLDAAFNIRSVLPVRNGPPLQMAFIDGEENRASLEDIKRNLERAYENQGDLALMRMALGDIVYRWGRFRPGCMKGSKGKEFCTNCDDDETAVCEMINKGRLLLEGKKQPITFTTLSKGLDKFTDIGCSCGRKNRVIHMRNEFTCPCGKRYVLTAEGWRPEPRCRLVFGSEACVAFPQGMNLEGSCDKTAKDCQRHGNFERFAP